MKLYIYDHCPFCVSARMIFGLLYGYLTYVGSTKGIAMMTIISFIIFLFFNLFSIIIASIMTVFVAVTPVFLPLESAI